MSVQHATTVQGVSFREKPRRGQIQAWEELGNRDQTLLSVKLPTGYGKTFTFCGAFSILRHQGRVNRLLVIFPTDAQLEQFMRDGADDLRNCSVEGPLAPVDIRFHGREAVKKHRKNENQIFCITVQSLLHRMGANNVHELTSSGSWMIVVDEHHHYGAEKKWGQVVLSLSRAFMLVLSATPSRSAKDGAFGSPHISVSYRDAIEEDAVKPLLGHSYEYRVDIVNADEQEVSYTTSQFVSEMGTADPDKVEKAMIERRMRWSPKYVSPLVSIPLERMLSDRIRGGRKLQGLVSAMCVSHAKLVCEQLREMFPELVVDWVGTGSNGRSDEENRAVLRAFCPDKDEDGNRKPSEVDVLVHVGMAGEGLNSVNVSEVVFLAKADLNNKVLQIVGRGARYLPDIVCNVSFDSSSNLSKYVGSNMELAMDMEPPATSSDGDDDDDDTEWPPELPEQPTIHIFNLEVMNIDSGTPGVRIMAKTLAQEFPQEFRFADLEEDNGHPQWDKVCVAYKLMRSKEAAANDERAVVAQWDQAVEDAVRVVVGVVMKIQVDFGAKREPSMVGKIKHKINARKKSLFGEKGANIDVLKKHYGWCKQLERELLVQKNLPADVRRLPTWLS